MKSRTIACLLFLSTLPLLSFGQQTDTHQSRPVDPIQFFETQRGEVELFKTLVYRYEIAWQESDVQSMIDLRNGLAEIMTTEIGQLQATNNSTDENQELLKNQQNSLKKLKAIPLVATDNGFGTKAETTKMLFLDFIRFMEADLAAQSVKLRAGTRQ